jgi:DNA replication protein DnaC
MPNPSCPTCRGLGWVIAEAKATVTPTLTRCACLAQEQAKARIEQVASAIGRLGYCTLDQFDADRPLGRPMAWGGASYDVAAQRFSLHTALQLCRAYNASTGRWLILTGPYGSGKSHLLAATLRQAALDHTLAFELSTVGKILAQVRAGFLDHSADKRIDELCKVALLGLDDLGAEHLSDWGEATMFDLLNTRYVHQRPTLITTNLTFTELYNRWPRIASRMAEQGDVVEVVANDYRMAGVPR